MGSYRKLVSRVEVHSYEVVSYTDPFETLLSPHYVEEKMERKQDGPYKALLISFSLRHSCYPIVFLRELTRGNAVHMGKQAHKLKKF